MHPRTLESISLDAHSYPFSPLSLALGKNFPFSILCHVTPLGVWGVTENEKGGFLGVPKNRLTDREFPGTGHFWGSH